MAKAPDPPFVLPMDVVEPHVALSDLRFLLHGWPKVGKTSLASYFPDAYLLKTEQGGAALRHHGVAINDWNDMKQAVKALCATDDLPFKTIVIDTIDRAYEYLGETVCADNGVTHLSQLKFGKGYEEANKRMHNMLEMLYAKFGVVLTSHSRMVEESRGAETVSRITPDLSGSQRKLITGWVDGIVYLMVDELQEVGEADGKEKVVGRAVQHVAVLQGSPYIEAGGRLRHLPPKLNLGRTPAEGFAIFEGAVKAAADQLVADYSLLAQAEEK